MIYVTSLNGSQIEPLINIGLDFKMLQSTDGTFTVSFSCFPGQNNPGYELLKSEAIVTVDGNDFRVKQYSNPSFSKSVTAVSTFYDHAKTQKHMVFSGSHTLQNHVNFALQETGWTAIVDSDIANVINYINKFGKDNVVSLIKKICKYHQCEYMILPNKRLHFAKQIGGDYDYQYRYKHNISSVLMKEDTTNLATVIKGYGKDGLEVVHTSPNVAIFGNLETDPITDERFTNAQALREYIAKQLQDVPELLIESTIPELTEREIGERVWLIYEPLNVEMQIRIIMQTKVMRNGILITDSVVFGNTFIKTSEDLLVDQQEKLDETKEELTENLDEAKNDFQSKFNQTDDRITLEVEQLNKSIARIDVKADNISLSVNNRITNEMASINIKADQIQSTVSAQATQLLGIDTRVANAESSITQQAHQITQKVSVTDFNGNTISSLINQTATTVKIRAQNIELQGAVSVLSEISGNLGTISSGNINIQQDIYMGRRLYFSDMTSVGGANGTIQLSAWNDIVYSGSRHSFNGTVDFSNANVIGIGGGGNTVSTNTPGLEITQSSNNPKTIVFKKYGIDIGTITLN